MFRFEHREQPPISNRHFVLRMLRCSAVAGCIVCSALMIGIAGYHWIGGLGWIDAFLNASMILGGMGPIGDLPNDAAKLFASAYALFSGLMFIGIMGVVLSPIIHRFLHKFHVDEKD